MDISLETTAPSQAWRYCSQQPPMVPPFSELAQMENLVARPTARLHNVSLVCGLQLQQPCTSGMLKEDIQC